MGGATSDETGRVTALQSRHLSGLGRILENWLVEKAWREGTTLIKSIAGHVDDGDEAAVIPPVSECAFEPFAQCPFVKSSGRWTMHEPWTHGVLRRGTI